MDEVISCKLRWIFNWLAQPGTIKSLGGLAAAAGYVISGADLEKWTAGAVAFAMLVNGLYDNNPRGPSTKTCEQDPSQGSHTATAPDTPTQE